MKKNIYIITLVKNMYIHSQRMNIVVRQCNTTTTVIVIVQTHHRGDNDGEWWMFYWLRSKVP